MSGVFSEKEATPIEPIEPDRKNIGGQSSPKNHPVSVCEYYKKVVIADYADDGRGEEEVAL